MAKQLPASLSHRPIFAAMLMALEAQALPLPYQQSFELVTRAAA
jgi:hypothetical protein